MRIESVTAQAFGPFKGQTLNMTPGMTVIHGPNESGKSRWHAALYAALCGIRRGPGQRREDRIFRDRHRPWGGSEWEVAAVVQLEDGRRVELRHDLDGRVACEARDADSGRDYTDEIINDGAPDASRWLGLDRRSFLSTACVRQADIQSVMGDAEALQEHLQRAAATAGADATAASALERLEQFQRQNVGQDRANSTRPLRSAKNRLEEALTQLEEARRAHGEYLNQLERVELLEEQLAQTELSLRLVEAACALSLAQEWENSVIRALDLASKYPEPPGDPDDPRKTAQTVRSAVERWDNQPAPVELRGPRAQVLHDELAQLPPAPAGDTRPHNDVVAAKSRSAAARISLERHQGNRPPEPRDVETGGLTPDELRQLASQLALEEPEIDPQLQQRVDQASEELRALRSPQGQTRRETSGPLLVRPFVFLARLFVAAIRALLGKGRSQADQAARIQALEELLEAESRFGNTKYWVEEVRLKREEARTTANEKGLPVDAADISELATRSDQAVRARSELERWEKDGQALMLDLDDSTKQLGRALESRGVFGIQPISQELEAYERDCARRDEQAREASRRSDLEQRYESRKQQEAIAADAERRRSEASRIVAQAAQAAGLSGDSEKDIVTSLRECLEQRERIAEDRQQAQKEWWELQELLDGGTVEDLEQGASLRRHRSEETAQGLEAREIEQTVLEDDLESQLNGLRLRASAARSDVAQHSGSLEQYAKTMSSVAEAEEELARADRELSRVTALDETLTTTQKFLQQAQERVHRTVAPKLREAVQPWLRAVTRGRYTEVRVDPETLMVYVSGDGRNWREAPLLSHGTAEQIYLLLRVAMSRLLTRDGEICPLILDDVTVHCDPQRQEEILSLLHSVSREQQVILFSQEPETLDWARENLAEPNHRLIQLGSSGIPV